MGFTRGIPWMDPDDPLANVDLEMRAMGEALLPAAFDPGLTIQAGWSGPTGVNVRKFGSELMFVEFVVTRTGATLTAAASGNLTGNDMALMPAGYRPARTQLLLAMRGAQGLWFAQLTPAGMVTLEGGFPTATVATADTLNVQGLVQLT